MELTFFSSSSCFFMAAFTFDSKSSESEPEDDEDDEESFLFLFFFLDFCGDFISQVRQILNKNGNICSRESAST